MQMQVPEKFELLAGECGGRLYAVGGSVRDFLRGLPAGEGTDWDLASPCTQEELLSAAKRVGLTATAVYPRTGTVKLSDGEGLACELTRFRHDRYTAGVHAPAEVEFTEDICVDARRRDFRCNAVYYDISAKKFIDPLGGIGDIAQKILRTVAPALQVFGEDGLRLMRLARQAAQTGFTPDSECLEGAREHAALIRDIASERVFHELMLLLHADEKSGDPASPYRGLCILRETGVQWG